MNTYLQLGLALTLGLTLAPMPTSADNLQSLRGDEAISGPSIGSKKLRLINDKEPVPRSFEQQPPLVPHKVDEYSINLKENQCLDCHSAEQAKEKDIKAISDSHYLIRDGKQLTTLDPRRYMCNQCHVPQFDAQPLVANTFKPLDTAQHR